MILLFVLTEMFSNCFHIFVDTWSECFLIGFELTYFVKGIKKMEYWESISKSESSDETTTAKNRDKGSGGSRGWAGGYMN